MTPRKPDALNTQGGLLLRQKPTMRTQLLLVCALCFVQLLVLAALGGGVNSARLLEQRVDTALEGTRVSAAACLVHHEVLQEAACVACSSYIRHCTRSVLQSKRVCQHAQAHVIKH